MEVTLGEHGPTPVLAVVTSVVAVVATLAGPAWLAAGSGTGTGPTQPAPTIRSDDEGLTAWEPVGCTDGESCAAPAVLDLHGQAYQRGTGRHQEVQPRDPGTRTLHWEVDLRSGSRWILVGAEGSSSASQLTLRFGNDDPVELTPGRLSFVQVPERSDWRVEVTVGDYGRAGGGEVLRVAEYQPNG